jgi:glycosyltransferase involved in cell wall biosynthesis
MVFLLIKSNIEVIYANDLFCGLLGMFVKTYKKNIYFIYDAHEVEFNRNREKNGLMRILYEIYLEKRIVTIADKIIVVNKPIKKLYENIYDIKEDKINIVNNNHFKYHYGFYKKNFKYGNIGILYIGKGVKGRLLEKLGYEADKMNIPIYSFFLGNIPDVAKKYKWYIGIKEYENKVKEIIKENTLLMWCVNEANCLSYKLALPNKFFQAIAFGMPVIAYKGTYLAEIVKKFNLGYIYEDNLKKIIEQIANKKNFFKIIENVENFQKLISEEKIVL